MDALRLVAVYFGTCCAVLWLARRMLAPFSIRAAAAMAFLPLLLTGPAMVTGSLWGALDLSYGYVPLNARAGELPLALDEYENAVLLDHVCEIIPWRKAVREAVKNGRPPLLDRFNGAGDVLLGGAQAAPFHPRVWIGFLLPLATAFTFACAFTLFLAALFAFLYLKELGLGELAATFGGAVWMTSGFVTFWCAWPHTSVMATMPLILLAVRRLARGIGGGFAAAVAGWTLALVGGHPESVLHVAAAAGAVFLWELAAARRPWRRPVGLALAGGVLAAMLAAPALLPFAEAVTQTQDLIHRHSETGAPRQVLPLPEALSSGLAAVYPHAYGKHWGPRGDVLPRRFDEASGAFVGGLALAFAVLAGASRRREKWLFAVLAALSFAAAVGLPGIGHLLARLPLFDVTLNGRLSAVTAFSLAVLAALGFEAAAWTEPGLPSSFACRRRVWMAMAAVAAALSVGGWLRGWWMADAGIDVAAHRRAVVLLTVPVLAAAVAAAMVRRRVWLAAAWLAIFLVAHRQELPRLYYDVPAELFYPPVEELARLPRAAEPYRVTGLGVALPPAQAAMYELEDVRSPFPMRHARLAATYPAWCVRQGFWFCRVDDLGAPLLAAMNVRFAIAAPGARPPPGWRVAVDGPSATILENPAALPRAFAPRRVRRVDAAELPGVRVGRLKAIRDFAELSLIEVDEGPFEEVVNGRAEVSTRADGPDLEVTVRAEAPAWIVVSQTFWKGWRAVDEGGRRLPLHFANHAFLGFRVEAGEHRVRLVYRPRSFVAGLAVSGLAVLILAVVLLRRGIPHPPGRVASTATPAPAPPPLLPCRSLSAAPGQSAPVFGGPVPSRERRPA
jgi:hypothetical protein